MCVHLEGAWTRHQRQWSMASWSQSGTWSIDLIGVFSSWAGLEDLYKAVIYVGESCVEMCSSGRLYFHQHGQNLDRLQEKAPKYNIPTKSMYGEGYPTEGERMCAFQWNHGLWNLSRNLRGQLVTICGCTVPWWFSALSGNGNKILWSSYKLWLYVYIFDLIFFASNYTY